MKLVVMRHGNTFAPGQTPVMVGANEDIPLVDRGTEQAQECGRALASSGLPVTALYCGPLRRTRVYAELVSKAAGWGLKPQTDAALTEIDYGTWSGLSDAQVIERFGAESLRSWREDGLWPTEQFVTTQTQARERVADFLRRLSTAHAKDACVALVTSAGVLRQFLELDPAAQSTRLQAKKLGFRTGNLGLLERVGSEWKATRWDVDAPSFA